MEHTPANITPSPASTGGGGDYLSINGFLEKTNTALTNAQLSDIAPLLEVRGYPAADIVAKLAEAEALRALNEKQQAEYGEQYEATEAYKKAKAAAHEDYMDYIKLSRIAFKNDTAAKTALSLRRDRAQSQSGYTGQGQLFYNNALGSTVYQDALKKKGITVGNLKAGQDAFKNLQTLTAAQQKETGEAQEATQLRDAAYDELHDWMSDFYETAKVALRKYPQMMEKLGIKEAS